MLGESKGIQIWTKHDGKEILPFEAHQWVTGSPSSSCEIIVLEYLRFG